MCAGSPTSAVTWLSGRSPLGDVVTINCQAEDIRWDKPQLCSAQRNYTDDGAIGGCDHPSLPHTASHQQRRKHGQKTRKIVETKIHSTGALLGSHALCETLPLYCAAISSSRPADSSRKQVSQVTYLGRLNTRRRVWFRTLTAAYFFSPVGVPVAKCSVSAEIWRAESRAPG
jgi:hypothetical protein